MTTSSFWSSVVRMNRQQGDSFGCTTRVGLRSGSVPLSTRLISAVAVLVISITGAIPISGCRGQTPDRLTTRRRMTGLANHARAMYDLLFPYYSDVHAGPSLSRDDRPLTGHASYSNSTEYFRWLIAESKVDVDYGFFGGPGLPTAGQGSPESFSSSRNAWCVVADVGSNAPPDVPVFFTRNLGIQRLNDSLEGAFTDEPPFGRQGVVVVFRDGCCRTLAPNELKDFNPSGATNWVLRP